MQVHQNTLDERAHQLVSRVHLLNVTSQQKERVCMHVALSILSVVLGIVGGVIATFFLVHSTPAVILAFISFSLAVTSLCCLLLLLSSHRDRDVQMNCARSALVQWNDLVSEYQAILRKTR